MKKFTLITAAFYGCTSIILGAFGAHGLKKILTSHQLESFGTGTKYQMYAALFLLITGLFLKFQTKLEKAMALLMIGGGALFCFSIYLLSLQGILHVDLRSITLVTPTGGVMMILSWVLLLIRFTKSTVNL